MNHLTLKDLNEAIIDEIIKFTKSKGNKGIDNILKEKSKIESAIIVTSNAKIDLTFKTYQDCLKIFLDDIKYQMEKIKFFPDISDDDCFLSYGLLCGLYCMFEEEKETIFENFNIERFPRIFEVIKGYTDVQRLKSIYINRLKCFINNSTNKNCDNKFWNWFEIIYDKNLSSITIKPKRKKRNKIKIKSSIEIKNKEEKTELENENEYENGNSINEKISEIKKNNNKLKEGNQLNNYENETILTENKSKNGENIQAEEDNSQNGNKNEIIQDENKIKKKEANSNNSNKNRIDNISQNEETTLRDEVKSQNENALIEENKSQNDNKEESKQNNNFLINNSLDVNEQINENNNNIYNLLNKYNDESSFSSNEKAIYEILKIFQKNFESINQRFESVNQELKRSKTKFESVEQELTEFKTNLEKLSKRVDLLEKNQILLYTQFALFQNSKDSEKSITKMN